MLSIYDLMDQPNHLSRLGVTFGFKLGVYELPIYGDLEPSTFGRSKCECVDHVLELFEQVACQAHGPVSVVSDCAIDDLDLEHMPSRFAVKRRICVPLGVRLGRNVRKL